MCPQNRKCFNIWKIEEKKGPCRLGCLEGYVNRIKIYAAFFFHRKNLTRYLHNSSVVLLLSLPCEYLWDYSVIYSYNKKYLGISLWSSMFELESPHQDRQDSLNWNR